MVPMLGREVEEGQQCLPVFRQTVDGFGIFGLVFVDKDDDGGLGRRPIRRVAHFPEVGFHVGPH